jgi:hypothetical protein
LLTEVLRGNVEIEEARFFARALLRYNPSRRLKEAFRTFNVTVTHGRHARRARAGPRRALARAAAAALSEVARGWRALLERTAL